MSADAFSPEVLDQATDWFFRVRGGDVDAQTQSRWLRWIEADPVHRDAFAEVQQTWNLVGQLESSPWRASRIEAAGKSAAASAGRPRALARWAALAATLAFLAVGGLLFTGALGSRDRITTGRGEQQSAVLSDGSRVELGGLTGIELKFTPQQRLVVADEGEAFYRVSHDASRPFVVQAGPVRITAVGTAFSVRSEAGRVSVVVSEGAVDVSAQGAASKKTAVRVQAGRRVQYDGEQLSLPAKALSADAAATWRRGLLRFEDEPLATVVASLNRYSSRRIVLEGAELTDLRFTGTVYDDSVEDWLAGVRNLYPVEVDESARQQVVIRPSR